VFKYVDEVRWGVTRFGSGSREIHFSDSYRYERAAYLLDRELGLRMVPVTVIREIRGREGCLSHFLDHASHEREPLEGLTGQQVLALSKQRTIMRIFDALIYNTDRNLGNWLVDDADRSLYLIDHSRSFREQKELPAEFFQRHIRLSRQLYEKLSALGEERLVALLGTLLHRPQIRAVLVRRDLILERIDQDREAYGDAFVFTD
jgi:hypothetical protein